MTDPMRHLDDALSTPGPARTTGTFRLGEMPGGSAIDVPFTVVRAAEPGPTVWMMAARDGDEVHATLIAMELQRRLIPEGLAGTVVVMPIGNVPGFGVLSREHPLAPTYLEQQMDDRYFDVLSERGGAFVDLHSAGVPSDTVDWTLIVEGDETGAAMGRAYGSPFLYEHRMGGGEGPDPGLLDGALFVRLSQAGVPSILIEAGGGLPPSLDTVQRGVSGVENVLRALGSLPGDVRPLPEPQILRAFRIVTPSRGGLFEDGVDLGEQVQEGQVLARVIDAHGGLVEEIRAPVAGVVLTVPVNPAVGTGTWAYEIGW
jgi:predicted deacylase